MGRARLQNPHELWFSVSIEQIFIGHLLYVRHCSRCWIPVMDKTKSLPSWRAFKWGRQVISTHKNKHIRLC